MAASQIAWVIAVACILLGCIFIRQSRTQSRNPVSKDLCKIQSRNSASKYPYKALQSGTSQIRVVVIHPGAESDRIIISVRLVSLKDNPDFEALSYAWGDASVTSDISVDGCKFLVGINLECALRHVRLRKEPRVLWIDAICINQSNIQERNQQVSRMKEIYAKARRVLVWLGPGDTSSDVAMDAIQENFMQTFYETPQLPERMARFTEQFLATMKLLERPWWSRCWVVQEVLSRKNVLVICGHRSIPWDNLFRLFYSLELIIIVGEGEKIADAPPELLRVVARLRYFSMNVRVGDDLLKHLHHLRQFKASDPRDKVWVASAILGKHWIPEPNYSLTLIETYQLVVDYYLVINDNLDIFEHCHMQGDMDSEFPSWIPDWRLPSVRLSLAETGQRRGRKFSASGSANAIYVMCDRFLHLTGFIFDYICSCLDVPPVQAAKNNRLDDKDLEVLNRVKHADIREADFPSTKYGTSSAESETEFRTELLRGTETVATGRKLMISKKKFVGLVPEDAKEGDLICIILGGNTPFVLRPFQNCYRMVGSCYVDGIMDGEAMKMLEMNEFSIQPIFLR